MTIFALIYEHGFQTIMSKPIRFVHHLHLHVSYNEGAYFSTSQQEMPSIKNKLISKYIQWPGLQVHYTSMRPQPTEFNQTHWESKLPERDVAIF